MSNQASQPNETPTSQTPPWTVLQQTLGTNAVWFFMEAATENLTLIKVIWKVNQVRVGIDPQKYQMGSTWMHSAQIAATSSTLESQQRIRTVMGWNNSDLFPDLPDLFSMKILFWNCRGAGNTVFRNNMSDLMREHGPEVLILLETKVTLASMNGFFNRFGLTDNAHVDPQGRVGGIWVLWNPDVVSITTFQMTPQVIHLVVTRSNYEQWLLSAVYASPFPRSRYNNFWDGILGMNGNTSRPWLMAGDFNDHVDNSEKRSYSSQSSNNRTRKFTNYMQSCDMMDLGCTGPKLTWTNGRKGLANTLVRLDRAMANPEWRFMFPNACVRNLPRTYSDHCPVLIALEGKVKLNTDGSCMGNPGPAGFGGLARDDKGNWLEGFAGFIGKATILKAELWAVREAMILIKKKDWMCAIVEVDSSNVLDLLKEEDFEEHPLKPLIQDCKSIMHEMKLSVNHTLREGNRCADAMAKIGVNQMEKPEVFHHIPSVVKEMLEADVRGTLFPRGF